MLIPEPFTGPDDIRFRFQTATAELLATREAKLALMSGARAPSFCLPDTDGGTVSSASCLSDGPLVVTFYQGVWCPYCTQDLQAMEEASAVIRELGARQVAISPQLPENSRRAQDENGLNYPVLSDLGGAVANEFGVRFQLPEGLRPIYIGLSTDLEVINGEPSWTLPIPSRYVIAQDAVIAYAVLNPDYTLRPGPTELFPILERLKRDRTSPRHESVQRT